MRNAASEFRPLSVSMVAELANPVDGELSGETAARAKHIGELSAALARDGHRVTVFTRRQDPKAPDVVETDGGFTVRQVPAGPARPLAAEEVLPHMGQFGRYLERVWTDDRPDIAHAHYWMSGIATQLATKMLALPAVQTFHQLGSVDNELTGRRDRAANDRVRMEQILVRGSTRVLAASTEEVFELVHLGLPKTRAQVVPWGVDTALFDVKGPTEEKGAGRRLVAAGKIHPSRGFDVVIDALRKLPDTELIIAGSGDPAELKRLRAAARHAKVASRVDFRGEVPHSEMPALLRSADVVVRTPWLDPWARTALEAMACGVPVVASGVGALRECVVDELTGRLVPAKNPNRLADAVSAMLADEKTRADMGAAGRSRVENRYSWANIAAETLSAYTRCVSAPPKTAKATPTP